MRPVIIKNTKLRFTHSGVRSPNVGHAMPTVWAMESGRRTSSTVFDTFRQHKIKARAVTAILNVTRHWIDAGKREEMPEQ
jgi:hypothetical protein